MATSIVENWPESRSISEQSALKSIRTEVEEKSDGATRIGTTKPSPAGASSAGYVPINVTATAVLDAESQGQAQAVKASSTVVPENGSVLAKEDAVGEASESDTDDGEGKTSTTNKKVSDRRRAQNIKFKSWYVGV